MGKKILIIDDNVDDMEIMNKQLKAAGFQDFFSAGSGKEGIKMAQDHNPDLIILDTLLPDIDGFEVCRRLKQNKNLSSQVIMLTGAVDAVDAGKAREAGCDDYAVKTADCAMLLNAVKKLMAV